MAPGSRPAGSGNREGDVALGHHRIALEVVNAVFGQPFGGEAVRLISPDMTMCFRIRVSFFPVRIPLSMNSTFLVPAMRHSAGMLSLPQRHDGDAWEIWHEAADMHCSIPSVWVQPVSWAR